jgi:outer membrane immunogenic protein
VNAPFAGTAVTASHLRAGWTAGAGVEWAFARTWTVKLEYLHIDTEAELLSGGTLNYTNSVIPPLTHQFSSSVTAQTSNLTLDTVRVGINHTFN